MTALPQDIASQSAALTQTEEHLMDRVVGGVREGEENGGGGGGQQEED